MKKQIAVLFLLSVSFCLTAQTSLSFNPQKGSKYLYQQKTVQIINQTMMGQEIVMNQEMSFDYELDVLEKGPDGFRVQYTYKDVEFFMSAAMMKMAYSSKTPNENPSDMDKTVGKMFGSFIGKSFTITVASDGSVKEVSGMEAIADEMIKSIATDGQIATQIATSLKPQFSDGNMKNAFEQSLKIYPEKAVKTGESWDVEQEFGIAGMSSSNKAKYTLKDVKKNVATIDVASTMKMKPETQGMTGDLTGTQTGVMQVDVKTGIPVSSDTSMELKGTISASGMSIVMSADSKIKTTITKK